MKTFAFLAFVPALASAMNVNYYSDGGCSNYVSSPPNVPADGSCYNWQWSGSNSANIANCDYGTCVCSFHVDANCGGPYEQIEYGVNDCASYYGTGFQSFACLGS
jgi:hypothetical protein